MLKRVNDTNGAITRLDLAQFFAGETLAAGYFEDRLGRVRRSFVVKIEGRQVPGGFVLEEEFHYSDGAIEHRTWRMWVSDDGASFTGSTTDVEGEAKGVVEGLSARLTYTMSVPVGNRRISMRFADAMHLMPDGTLLAHAVVSKFGVTLGHVIISFRKA
ncbi:MAG: DUF3833 family protein [Hyphomicrobiales bacterium]